ncbi:MAG: glycosyl transferase [Clostridia bacterium]|nr:glycosyl transferase [Clostridia bacterium]
MDNIFCTLFDSNYLDKGLVLYRSMEMHLKDFKLYIFAFDDKCAEILKKENLKNAIVVSLNEFETDALKKVKTERTAAEYCWTCTPWTIKYVLEKYNENICTYIDADMMFFSSPQYVFDDMRDNDCSIIIVPHRFGSEKKEEKAKNTIGTYCVEFNTFVKDKNGMAALNWWAEKCLEWCFYALPGTTEWYGDQKYLNEFPKKFSGVYICNHYGLGMAPWNVSILESTDTGFNPPYVRKKGGSDAYPVILYHYANAEFLTRHILQVPFSMKSKKMRKAICDSYVEKLFEERAYLLHKYRILLPRTKRVLTNNKALYLYKRYLYPLKILLKGLPKGMKGFYWIKENS